MCDGKLSIHLKIGLQCNIVEIDLDDDSSCLVLVGLTFSLGGYNHEARDSIPAVTLFRRFWSHTVWIHDRFSIRFQLAAGSGSPISKTDHS